MAKSEPKSLDYAAIRLMVGLEVHQQLATRTKLFCACPPFSEVEEQQRDEDGNIEKVSERFPFQFKRILRPAASELGEIDQAARFESRHEIKVKYFANLTSSCLVEADEEPPHPLNADALETALLFSLALDSKIVSEIHVMRKIVVDGSNTSGFQRTAVIALGGTLQYGYSGSSVAIQSISLEEDAARALKVKDLDRDERAYALDRLGTPLVEVASAPIERKSPEEIAEAAAFLGRLMRSTGRVARGLGTIRQDLNISVMNGKVIEVKGVQRLEMISKVIEYEAARQKFFLDLAQLISARRKGSQEIQIASKDVTEILRSSESRIIKGTFAKSENPQVLALVAKSFAGLLGMENEFHARLGKELGAIARTYGIGGVFHSDELPDYGITLDEVRSLRKVLSMEESDAFVLISGESSIVRKASDALIERLKAAAQGVPAETRAATEDGETTFLRPRPGAARMYPETDIPLISIRKDYVENLKSALPERWEVLVERFAKEHDLPKQLAEPLLDSDKKKLFLEVSATTKLSKRYVASVLLDTLQSLSREGLNVERTLQDDTLKRIFILLDSGGFAKEAMPELLRVIAKEEKNPVSVELAISRIGGGAISLGQLEKTIEDTIVENEQILKEKGTNSQSAIMGKVMQKVRGKADGKLVNEAVKKALAKYYEK